MRPRRIEVSIGVLVLEGLHAGREEVELALGRELGGLLGSRELPTLGRDRAIPVAKTQLGSEGRSSARIGQAIGSAVVEVLSR